MDNYMKLQFASKSCNEAFARATVGAFASQLDPTIEELSDIKTALSEAVTNAIIHGYENKPGVVTIECKIHANVVSITVSDAGKGIADIEQAMTPLYTSHPEQERSGMGFTVMETFMDSVNVNTVPGSGTDISMTKKIHKND